MTRADETRAEEKFARPRFPSLGACGGSGELTSNANRSRRSLCECRPLTTRRAADPCGQFISCRAYLFFICLNLLLAFATFLFVP